MPTNIDEAASPLVTNIVITLTERIGAGYYRGSDGFPSERHLVNEFGVSRTIVRRALEVLERESYLVRSARCRTVVSSEAAEAPTRRQTRRSNIGLWIWPNPTEPASAALAQGICRALDHSQYRLVIGNFAWDSWDSVRRSEAQFLEQMAADRDIVGVLLGYVGSHHNLPALERLRAAGVPMVFIDRQPPAGFEADHVGADNETAAEKVVSHLIAQGHRRIAHIINGDTASTVVDRMAGYRRALKRADIPFHADLVVKATEASGVEAPEMHGDLAHRLLTLSDPPTAAFAVNDVMAYRFMAALRARGLRIPDDMAVAGFDGLERWSADEPFLTTIRQPFEAIGMRAAKMLLQRIESMPTLAYQHVLLEAPLCIYGSTLIGRRDSSTTHPASGKGALK